MAQSDLRLAGDREPRNETARLRGGPHVRQSRGNELIGVIIFPDKPLSVKPEMTISGDGGALPDMRHVPATGLTARRETHVHRSTIAAAAPALSGSGAQPPPPVHTIMHGWSVPP